MKQLIICSIIVITIITGCRYKEGPLISFYSVYTRIKGTWQIIGLTSDGVDSLQYYNDSCGSAVKFMEFDNGTSTRYIAMVFNYNKNNQFGASVTFQDNKNNMYINFGAGKRILGPIGAYTSKWEILKLTNDNLKVSIDFNGRNYKISFKKLSL